LAGIVNPEVSWEMAFKMKHMYFCSPEGKEVEGPLGGAPDLIWGTGTMGFGPVPAARIYEKIEMHVLKTINIFKYVIIYDHKTQVPVIRTIVKLFGKYLASERLPSNKMIIDGFENEVGPIGLILLAMYSRLWCFNIDKETVRIGINIDAVYTDIAGIDLVCKIAKWSPVPTYMFTKAGDTEEKELSIKWTPGLGDKINDAECIISKLNAISENHNNFYVVDTSGATKLYKINSNFRKDWMLKGDQSRTTSGGTGSGTVFNVKVVNIVNFDERFDKDLQVGSNKYDVPRGCLYRFILIPRTADEKQPRITFFQETVSKECPDPKIYLQWAKQILTYKLSQPWHIV
jgi:hypothetical protein